MWTVEREGERGGADNKTIVDLSVTYLVKRLGKG